MLCDYSGEYQCFLLVFNKQNIKTNDKGLVNVMQTDIYL